ncbi:hypothetical protein ABT330_14180 [Streptomyces sp. NPDC000658]|uniref:hypothetical protein n=1 Tax=Streptomyces sp. NPDC000658 TaxID=3154266 RepID=UPI00331C7530
MSGLIRSQRIDLACGTGGGMTVQRVLDQLQGWSYQASAAIRQPSEVRMNWMVIVHFVEH